MGIICRGFSAIFSSNLALRCATIIRNRHSYNGIAPI
jgi:hypothetical protein